MKKSHHACRYVCGSLAVVTAAASWTPLTVYAANASSSNFDMRQQVVSLTGIMDVTSFREEVTRGDFARMLVNASSYRENLPTVAVLRMSRPRIRMPSIYGLQLHRAG